MHRIEADIAGTKIPLKISEDEEVYVKKAIEEVNKRVRQYQSEFNRMDIHDCIRMALLAYAVDQHKSQARIVDDTSWNTLLHIQAQLKSLDKT